MTRSTIMFLMTFINKAGKAEDPSSSNQDCPDHLCGNFPTSKATF